jgi:hypothetical protein
MTKKESYIKVCKYLKSNILGFGYYEKMPVYFFIRLQRIKDECLFVAEDEPIFYEILLICFQDKKEDILRYIEKHPMRLKQKINTVCRIAEEWMALSYEFYKKQI